MTAYDCTTDPRGDAAACPTIPTAAPPAEPAASAGGRPREPAKYLRRADGRAFTWVRDSQGNRRQLSLGAWGSKESWRRFAAVAAVALRGPVDVATLNGPAAPDGPIVAELVIAFLAHARKHYVKDGRPTGEHVNFELALEPLGRLYDSAPTSEILPAHIRAVRDEMVKKGWRRTHINGQLRRVRHVFRWGLAEGLMPPEVVTGVEAIRGLRAGQTSAPEGRRIVPVADDMVRKTLPFLPPMPRALVELLSHTGARAGEIVQLRLGDLDTSDRRCWIYRPRSHKTEHHDKGREILLGPKAIKVLRPWLTLDRDAFVFSPKRSEATRLADLHERRKSKVPPSQQDRARRARANPRRVLADRYTTASLGLALWRACEAAGIHWHLHQLRHAFGFKVRRLHGLEVAQPLLGHARAAMTERYAAGVAPPWCGGSSRL
jgi:integrase